MWWNNVGRVSEPWCFFACPRWAILHGLLRHNHFTLCRVVLALRSM